jgi:hypothetical protein
MTVMGFDDLATFSFGVPQTHTSKARVVVGNTVEITIGAEAILEST